MTPTSAQLTNAEIIINVGNQHGATEKHLLAAIEAALVESGLRNLNYGDRDSLGLFQQRPSQGWGTQAQVMDPYYAANAFFVGAGTNPGALEVNQSGTAGQLAQRVQRSAFPSRYDQRERDALQILAQLGAGVGPVAYENFFGIPVTYEAGSEQSVDDVISINSVPAYDSYEEYLAATGGRGSWSDYLNSGQPMLLPGDRPPQSSSSFGGIGTILLLVVGVIVVDSVVNG